MAVSYSAETVGTVRPSLPPGPAFFEETEAGKRSTSEMVSRFVYTKTYLVKSEVLEQRRSRGVCVEDS